MARKSLKGFCLAYFVFCFIIGLYLIYHYGKLAQTETNQKVIQSKSLNSPSIPDKTHDNSKPILKEFSGLPFSEIKCGEKVMKNSTFNGKKLLVPDVVFFVWFAKDREFRFFNYLALRSAASIQQPKRIDFYYSKGLPKGKHWERALKEIACLHLKKMEEPKTIAGVKIRGHVQRTDMARLHILLEQGGMYLDGDVITLKRFDPLRVHPTTLGRATKTNVCICIVLSQKNTRFISEYYKYITTELHVTEKTKLSSVFTKALGEYMNKTMVKVHIEESSFNRPNPFVKEDGKISTITGNFDMSDNYFLHLHTRALWKASSDAAGWLDWEEDELRKLDTVYGEAARLALFGSSDLVFLPGETVFEKKEKRKMVQFPPIQQPKAVIDDAGDETYF